MPAKKNPKPLTWDQAMKKYGNDITKIPGWSGVNPDGKVKPQVKKKKK